MRDAIHRARQPLKRGMYACTARIGKRRGRTLRFVALGRGYPWVRLPSKRDRGIVEFAIAHKAQRLDGVPCGRRLIRYEVNRPLDGGEGDGVGTGVNRFRHLVSHVVPNARHAVLGWVDRAAPTRNLDG